MGQPAIDSTTEAPCKGDEPELTTRHYIPVELPGATRSEWATLPNLDKSVDNVWGQVIIPTPNVPPPLSLNDDEPVLSPVESTFEWETIPFSLLTLASLTATTVIVAAITFLLVVN